jgi:hypothetical protein
VLEDPLRNSADSTIFRRIGWAPDGQSLCITCSTKSGKHVGMVLKRGTWTSVADLVGHASPSITARFCPHLLYRESAVQVPGAKTPLKARAVGCLVVCLVIFGTLFAISECRLVC